MTLEELEKTLPNGLHDAFLRGLNIDLAKIAMSLELDVDFSSPEDPGYKMRACRITLSGLAFCVITPPVPKSADLYVSEEYMVARPLREVAPLPPELPPVPEGAFGYVFATYPRNIGIFIAARDARLDWTG
ncbi:MAG TPA: hypothetical protein VHQ90_20725 [Thermoanaerobaculia bacterium]|nr:hypothetical protein [Thermoanaerobaculia bacterium]